MSGTKHTMPPENFFSYFWNEYILFRYDFVIRTSAWMEDCIENIEEINQKQRGWWRWKLETTITPWGDKQYFKIIADKTMDRRLNREYEGARLQGFMQRRNGVTTVHGTVMLGWEKWLFGVLGLSGFLLFSLVMNMNILYCFTLILCGYAVKMFLQTFGARQYLIQQLHSAIREAEAGTQKSILSGKSEPNNVIVLDDSLQHQSTSQVKR